MPLLEKDKRNQNLMNLIRRVHSVVEHADIEKHRQSQNYFGALLGNTRETRVREAGIEGMYGEWIEVKRPHRKKQIILYCHGGGYSTGSCLYARALTTRLAISASVDVLSFDYRLAPEHPFPAALEDAGRVWDYLMLQGYGARDIIVAGDSAGGNLALVLVHKLKQEGRMLPGGLALMSPWTDLTSSGKSYRIKKELDPVLDEEYLKQMISNYVEAGELENPLVSPLFGDFTGFPPVYIQAGENEILLSDSALLHKKLEAAGVPARIEVFEGMWHVFQMARFKTANEAMDRLAEFILDIFG
ncbi:MAG: alpha/beta hydrolase [Lachnospiraceae bacterium]|nr:alpha/beta hydrolase [Lachnospiraceae bacterium]